MQEQIQRRLEELRREFEAGQGRLRELEAQQAQLQQTVLRISGAIQVLEEELEKAGLSQRSDTKPQGETGNGSVEAERTAGEDELTPTTGS